MLHEAATIVAQRYVFLRTDCALSPQTLSQSYEKDADNVSSEGALEELEEA